MIAQDATILLCPRSVVNRFRSRCAQFEHSAEHVDGESDCCRLCLDVSASESAANEFLVSVEGILDSCLLVVIDLFPPLSATEFTHRLIRKELSACPL